MIKIFDKAAWQIDAGVREEDVISHFSTVFEWLHNNHMLNEEGEEEYDDGIDDSASLNEKLLNEEGLKFLDECYDLYLDTLLRKNAYGKDTNGGILSELYHNYLNRTEL